MNTPWGLSQHEKTYGTVENGLAGIKFYWTAAHGGFYVPPEHLRKMPAGLRAHPTFCGDPHWFEEDEDGVIVVLAFPHLFDDAKLHAAVGIASAVCPMPMMWGSQPVEPMPVARAWLRSREGIDVCHRAALYEEARRASLSSKTRHEPHWLRLAEPGGHTLLNYSGHGPVRHPAAPSADEAAFQRRGLPSDVKRENR